MMKTINVKKWINPHSRLVKGKLVSVRGYYRTMKMKVN